MNAGHSGNLQEDSEGQSDSISISKEVLPSLDGLGFSETILGERRGSLRQYRNASGIHVREYPDRFVIHRDRVDPRSDPLGHLVKDSPETLLAFGTASLVFFGAGKDHSKRSRDEGEKRSVKEPASLLLGPLSFLFVFFSLKTLLGRIKQMFFS
jgi:hypothetical protein